MNGGRESTPGGTPIDIEFVDELPGGRWNGMHLQRVRQFADRLRQNPGRWAVYPWASSSDAARAFASRVSRGKNKTFPEGFEAVTRNGRAYVRYEGGDD